MGAAIAPRGRLRLRVSEDRLKAWVQIGDAHALQSPPPAEEILALLDGQKIVLTDAVRARAAEVAAQYAELAKAPPAVAAAKAAEELLVVECPPPVDAVDGHLEWSDALKPHMAPPTSADRVDYFHARAIVTVAQGTPLGRVLPPQDGTSAHDVYGRERPPHKPQGVMLELGAGVRLASEGSATVVAEVAGRVLDDGGKLRVVEVLELSGDVDLTSGSIESVVDVVVHGTVRANFCVRTKKSLRVDKVVEAADVEADGDAHVHGGIFGREGHGHVRVGGHLHAHLVNEMRVTAGGDVSFDKELLNSRVRAYGHLAGERGTIIGGSVWARCGAVVRVVGSEASVGTMVAVGTDLDVLRRVRQMERRIKDLQKSADQIRQAVQPLMANLRRLLPAQREKATELLCKADEIDLQVGDLTEEIKRRLAAGHPPTPATIVVSEMLYPGTRVRIETREAALTKLLHGPVKLELRKVHNATELVAVNQRTGSVTVLPSTDAELDGPLEDQESQGDAHHGAAEPAGNTRPA